MKKERKSTATPALRFPEFRDTEEWRAERMGKLYSFMRNNALSRDKLNYESGTVKNVHYGDIHTKFSTLFDIAKERVPYVNSSEVLPEDDSEDYCIAGDIIFADASEDTNDVGKSIEIVRLNGERLLSGQHTILARRKDDTLIVGFGGHLFRSGRIRFQIEREAQGTKVYAISSGRLANIEIVFPNDKREQQRIGDCLTSLDDAVAAQGKKVAALKAHKIGLLQQLFPCEGETLPRLRFPEFRDSPEWQEIEAGALFANRTEKGNDDLPIYSVTMTDGLVKRASLDRRIDDLANAEGNKKAYKRDIVYNMMRMWQGACGVASEECMVSPAYVVLSPKPGVDSDFYGYLFKLPWLLQLLTSHSHGLTKDRLRLYYHDFGRIRLPRPDIDEQRRIANCVRSIDATIAAESARLEVLRAHKKGLMLLLFPSKEEA